MTRTLRTLVTILAVCGATQAHAQAYPSKSIHIVVPYPPGGPNDVVGRIVATGLSEAWKSPVVVENRPGASGTIGAQAVARAAGDGYTLLIGAGSSTTIQSALNRNLAFDPLKDFAPITPLAAGDYVLVMNASSPVRTFDEFVTLARKQPSGLIYGSAGNGSVSHLASELMKTFLRVSMVHVPYQGGAPAIIDLLGGHVAFVINDVSVVLSHVKGGKLVALATTGRARSRFLPAVPTLAESGMVGYEARAWYGLLAPRGTPAEIVDRLNAETRRIMERPDVRTRLDAAGAETFLTTPGEFADFMKADLDRWGAVIRANDIKL